MVGSDELTRSSRAWDEERCLTIGDGRHHTTSLSTNALSFVASCFLTNIRLTADQRVSCAHTTGPVMRCYHDHAMQVIQDLDKTKTT